MKPLQCLIVEDEPLASEVIMHHIKQIPFLNLAGVCTDAIHAIDFLQNEKIDVIFLDIHLPKLKGLDFAKSLKNPPKIIITSAYADYALEGYELNIIDYLLKPIEFSRFFSAVNKLQAEAPPAYIPSVESLLPERKYIFFNVNKKMVKVYLDEILFIESLREYLKITTENQTILTKFQISEIDAILPHSEFIRVHRSFIIALEKIDAYSQTDIEIHKHMIPVGRNYKELVHSILKNRL
ncbi:LytR/AlgR family response regulator transcription factor [Niabella beijingensis]|uniref:LytR/AlgR family response regulator transcription factor n=1 Tax=Niabella beijingensis TaxID=2872700 RepID=UPI001CC05F97|nr:LytTR family DNA-binding domain-containing protein [Niabella beijingensis]MBZ4189417.1 LytTR family DNA-binding domain-containing protein [Niabella beijingensis]